MKKNNEKLVQEIILAFKIDYEITVEEDKILKGDLKKLKQDIEDYELKLEDYGIGHYEYGGATGFDSQETVEIDHNDINIELTEILNGEDPSDVEDLVDFLTEKMKIERTFETERKPHAEFELKVKNYNKNVIKDDKVIHTFTLYWK